MLDRVDSAWSPIIMAMPAKFNAARGVEQVRRQIEVHRGKHAVTSGLRYRVAIAGLLGNMGVPGSNAISICLSMCSSGISSSMGTFIGPVAERTPFSSLTSRNARTLTLKAAREGKFLIDVVAVV